MVVYASPKALEMAVKEAAKASPLNTSEAISNFYYHRLLYRVFSNGRSPFVLKGGLSVLARTLDARTTRDIDLVTHQLDIDEAVKELIELVSRGADDFISFEFISDRAIKQEDDYRAGRSLLFDVYLGARRIMPVSVDLVSDEIPLEHIDMLDPIDRMQVGDLDSCAYPTYPAERAIADKVCAIIERHGGRPSSRVKDFVDIIIYAMSVDVSYNALARALSREAASRHLALGDEFLLPAEWGVAHERQYRSLSANNRLFEAAPSLEEGLDMAKRFLDPAIRVTDKREFWSHVELRWLSDGRA